MKLRRLGRTGLMVSELCLGTNTFGGGDHLYWRGFGGLDQEASDAVMAAAFNAGITLIDTADKYAEGQSEERIGQGLRNLGQSRHDVVIATKAGLAMGDAGPNHAGASRGHLIRAVEASLRRLQTDYIDIFMLHLYDPATPVEETMHALDHLLQAGKIRYAGCSNFAAWQVLKANGAAALRGFEPLHLVEAHWSAAARGIERDLVPMIRDQGLGLLIWGPMLGGLLSGKFDRTGAGQGEGRNKGQIPEVLDPAHIYDVIDALRSVAARHGASVANVALAWVLAQDGVTSVLFGARDPAQVAQNARAADLVLDAGDLALIAAAAPLTPDYGPWSMRGSMAARAALV